MHGAGKMLAVSLSASLKSRIFGQGSVDCDDIGSAGPFFGGWQKAANGGGGGGTWKGTTWEGGHHVVGVAAWKGMIKPGQVSHALVSSLDFVPTFAALAGVALPSDRVYDGMDITNVLLHGATTCLLYTSPSPRDQRGSRMPSSA